MRLRERPHQLHCAVARQDFLLEQRLYRLLNEERIAAGTLGD
jgi:hypothetical protein